MVVYLFGFGAFAVWQLFGRIFPDEEFFPEAAFSEPEDDSGLDQNPNDVESLDS